MSRKVLVGTGAAVMLAGVALVAGALVTGFQTKKALQASPPSWPGLKVIDQQYSQGLFSATRTVTLQAGCAAAGSPTFALQQRIKHGPLPGFSSFGAAVIDSELIVPEAARKAVNELTGGLPPLSIHTVVAFGGATRSQVTVPAFHFRGPKGEQLSFQGLQADLRADGERLRYELAMPGLNIAGKDPSVAVEMRLTGLKAHGELVGAQSIWLRPGKSEGELASLEFSAMNQVASAVPPVRFALSGLKLDTDTGIASDLITSTSRLRGQGSVGAVKLDKIELQASLKRLHAPTYEKLMQRVIDSAASCDAQVAAAPQLLLQQVQQDLAALLPYGPEYALDKLALEIDGKRGELSYAVGISGVTPAELQSPLPALLMSKGQVRGQFKVPSLWVEKMMANFGGAQQQDPAAQAEMMNVMLTKMAGDGYIVRDGEMLSGQMSFEKGQLLVNGKPMPPPQ